MDLLAVDRLPRHPLQGHDPVRRRRQHPAHPPRGRLPGAPVRRPGRDRPRRRGSTPDGTRRSPQAPARARARTPSTSRRSPGSRSTGSATGSPTSSTTSTTTRWHPRTARLHRRRRLPHPHRQGRSGHERVHAGHASTSGGSSPPCCRAAARPALLHTYSAERQAVAEDLIDFDTFWSSAPWPSPSATPSAGARRHRPDECRPVRHPRAVHRRAGDALPARRRSPRRRPTSTSPRASRSGLRFHSAPVVRLADAKRVAARPRASRGRPLADLRLRRRRAVRRCCTSRGG